MGTQAQRGFVTGLEPHSRYGFRSSVLLPVPPSVSCFAETLGPTGLTVLALTFQAPGTDWPGNSGPCVRGCARRGPPGAHEAPTGVGGGRCAACLSPAFSRDTAGCRCWLQCLRVQIHAGVGSGPPEGPPGLPRLKCAGPKETRSPSRDTTELRRPLPPSPGVECFPPRRWLRVATLEMV